MVSLKRLNPFAKTVTSISKTQAGSQTNAIQLDDALSNTLFIPTLNDKQTLQLWVSYVSFFSILGIIAKIPYLSDFAKIVHGTIETIIICIFIVTGEMLFIAISDKKFKQYKWRSKQISSYLLGSTLVVVPLLNLAGRAVLFFVLGYEIALQPLIKEIAANVMLTFFMIGILLIYFNLQYQTIRRVEKMNQQKITTQNEQLKARITPHFFFNLLNTMQYLVESNPTEAAAMIRHVSSLYRVSFDETKEIALLDEIELCKNYLSIEKYRFDKKLQVTWQLPDEDLLYDMVISSLTLQMVIEKIIVVVVEMTTEAIHINIAIDWLDDVVTIDISTQLPPNNYQTMGDTIREKLNFNSQIDILKQYYGEQASITYEVEGRLLTTNIAYPLKDIAALA